MLFILGQVGAQPAVLADGEAVGVVLGDVEGVAEVGDCEGGGGGPGLAEGNGEVEGWGKGGIR